MKVALTGATGTIGRALVAALRDRGDEVVALSRDPAKARSALGDGVEAVEWAEPAAQRAPVEPLRSCDAVVNLMGAPVAQRWSDSAKRSIRDSRVLGTRGLVEALEIAEPRPRVLVSQSASGWYGPRGDEPVDESEPPADDFLARVVREWEGEAHRAEELGMRVVLTRTGVVLSESGALEKMLPPFKLGVGGPVAGGNQYVPWIHLDDVVGALTFSLDSGSARGVFNVSSPNPATNRELSKTLGRILRRPAVAPVPALALRMLYGEMAQIVTGGVRAVPSRLQELGYEFRRPELEPALRAALGR